MSGNKRIAHTINDHLVAGLLLVCMAGISESAYAQDVAATGGIVTIEPVSTSRLVNEAGGTYEFDVVFEFLPTNATFFGGRRRVPLGFTGGRLLTADASMDALDPRVTPTQDYSVSVDGVEQTLDAVRPTRPGTTYRLPPTAIEFGSGLVMELLPADRRLTRRVRFTAKDDGVDEGPNTTPGVGTEFVTLTFTPDNPDGEFVQPSVGTTLTPFRNPIIIIDNDSNPPGVTVTATTLTTSEGDTATFTVVLDSEPAGYEEHQIPRPFAIPSAPNQTVPVYELTNEVRVTVTSTDSIDGGLVSSVGTTPAISTVLTFTDSGGTTPWDTPQTVTVNAADNLVSGSDVIYDITFDADGGTFTPGSEGRVDNDYDSVTVAAVSVTNTDNDGMHGVIVTETGGSTSVAENSGTDTFTVALRSAPTNDVVLTLTSSDTNEGTVRPGTLTFSATNWNTPQTVTVTGVNDDIDSDDSFTVDFAITDEGGVNYPITPSAPVVTVTATNDDNASRNITLVISPTGVAETADNTTITVTATLGGTVVLGTPTNITVTVGAPGDSARRGNTEDYTGTSAFTLTIPALTLSATRTFSIDPNADTDSNNETITISGAVTGFTVTSTTLTINDAGLSVFRDASGGMPISSTGFITGANEGAAHTFYVRLTRAPTGNVVVTPTSRNPTGLTVNTPSLTFTTTNWDDRQAVRVTGVDDDVFSTDSTAAEYFTYEVDFAVTTGDGSIYPNGLPLASADVRVTDNDRVTLVLSAFPTDIPESAGPTTVTVTAMLTGSTRVSREIVQNLQLLGAGSSIPGRATLQTADNEDATVTSPVRPSCGANCRSFGPVTIPALGDSGTTTFEIDPVADMRDEGRESLRIDGSGRGYGVMDTMETEIFIVESGVLAFEALTGGASIDAITIDEASSDILYVQLASQPATGSSVVIGVTSSDTNEGTVNMATLTFTDTTWETRQALTVTTVPDNSDRDDTFMVNFAVMTGDGGNYPTSLTIPPVTVTVADDDVAGIDGYDALTGGSEISAITTSEAAGAGNTATFYIELTSQPTGTVTVTIGDIDAGEHTLTTPASGTLTFDSTNWNNPRQEITITGVDDNIVDDDQTYDITLTAAGGGYDGVVETVSLTNTDDDTAALSIADTTVDEDAGTATLTVTLTPAVTAGTVEVDLTTADGTAEAGTDYTAITSETLTFVAGNTTQTLDITINDDAIDESDETFTVMLDNLVQPAAVTGDVSIADSTATVTITDDDTLSDTIDLIVNPSTVPETADATTVTVTATIDGTAVSSTATVVTVSVGGGTATVGADYTAVPNFTLTIPALSSSGMATFMIDPNTSSTNGDTVTISGVATINGMTAMVNSATLTIVEAGISVFDAMSAGNPISTATIAEASGTGTLYVQLVSQPAANVVIGVTSSDTGEGMVSPGTLTFTDTNWNTRQAVTVTAVPDNVDRDGDSFMMDFEITTGDGGNYTSSLTLPSVTVTITDDDTVGFTVDIGDGVTTSETGTTDTFTVVLDSQPTDTVTVTISGLRAEEHSFPPFGTTALTFTTTNWSNTQTITLTGVDDDVVDGNQTYDLTLTPSGGDYATVAPVMVSITNEDDDTAALSIADLSVNENATTATVTVTLSAMVTTGDVMVDVTTADGTATAGEDYTAITSQTLTFTGGSTSETLDITISDDNIAEGSETFTVMLSGLVAPTGVTIATAATVTITDDETAPTTIDLSVNPSTVAETADATTITVTATLDGTVVSSTPTVVTVSVGGGTGTATSGTDYTAVPNFDLTIPALSSSATGIFMIDPTDDSTSDNGETVMISGVATGFTVNPATLTISEAGISVFDVASGGTPTNTITIADENSGTTMFYVRLISAPASDITLSVASGDTDEGTVLPATLTFTATPGATSWDSRQLVTVTAVPDDIDRDDTFTVDFAITSGDTGNYPTSLTIPPVTVTITDDDTAGIALFDMATGTDAPSITTTEGATTDSFYVVLESEPTGTVTVTISGLRAGEHTSVPPSTLTFTPTAGTAWNIRQVITLTGVDDDVVDGDETYDLTLRATGGGYDSVTAPTVSITNEDDDTAAISIADLTVDENAGTATLTVTLTPAVTAGTVEVDGTTTDGTATIAGGDYTVITSETLTFTAGSTTQTLDIPINDDTIDETDETFTVMLDNLMLPAPITGDVSIADATAQVTITDDDTLSDTINLSISPSTVAETADATTITVTATIDGMAVSTMPTAVTVSVGGGTATSGTDYTAVSDFTLTIPAESASGMATFMIDPTDDTADDNNEVVTISGTAGGFTTVNAADLTIVEVGISVFEAQTAGNQISTIIIDENNGTGMLYVQLASPPAGNVTLSVTSDDTNEGMVSPGTLTFITTNWNTRQAVTVTAVPDNVDRDGDSFMVDFRITTGDGDNYISSLTLSSVAVTITDDDTAPTAITLSVNPSTVAETAGATTITVTATLDGTVVLTTPTDVMVTVGGGTATVTTDYTATPTTLTITIPALVASATQTFTITPVDDTTTEGEETVMISGTAGGFTTVNPATLDIVEAGILVFDAMSAGSQISTATIAEASGTNTLYVQLTSEPATGSSVVIGVTSSDTREGTVSPGTLTFTDTNWETRQALTVTTVDDNVDRDGDTFMLDFEITSGDGGNYTSSLELSSVTVLVTDNDVASDTLALTVSPNSVIETAGETVLTVTATLNGAASATDTAVEVIINDGGTATPNTDYTLAIISSGDITLPTGTITLPTSALTTITIPEEMTSGSGTFAITPIADDVSDNAETLTISGAATINGNSVTITPATLTIIEFSEEEQQVIEQTVAAQASSITQVVSENIGSFLASRTSAPPSAPAPPAPDGGGGDVSRENFTSIDWQDWQGRFAKLAYEGLKRMDSGADMSLDWALKAAGSDGRLLMPLGVESLTLWAAGGRLKTKGDGMGEYDGGVNSFVVGVDTNLINNWLLGMAASYSDSQVDYTMDGAPIGTTEQNLYSVHPFLSHSLPEHGLTLWITGGYGVGDIDFSHTTNGEAASDVTQWMAAGGIEKHIVTNTSWQGALRLKGLWGNAEVDATEYDNGVDIRKVESTFWRARMESEMGYNFQIPGGGNIRPYALIGGRWDHNDAIVSGDEWHIDIGGGVEVLSGNAFALNISLHTQVTDGDTEEDSIIGTGSLTYDIGHDRQGLQITLSRPLNNTSPSWDQHSFNEVTDTVSGVNSAPLTSELAYGWTVRPFALEGALQTYVQNSFDSHDRHYAVGLELIINALTLNFESSYGEAENTGLESLFKTKIRW